MTSEKMDKKFVRAALCAACALGIFALFGGCVPDEPLKIAYNDAPASLNDGWAIAAPESQGIDRTRLREAYRHFFSENEYITARSLLVVRNGYLVAEGYCRDREDILHKGALQSATKSVTSLLVGIAMDRGLLDSVDRTIYSVIPEEFGNDPAKKAITLRHLLTMRSGLSFSNDHFTLEMAYDVRGDGIAHILSKPLINEPGTFFNYQDCDPQLVSAALQRLVGTSLEEFARTNLFAKIGIGDYVWLAHRDGTTYGPYGLYLRPRDLARIGKLVAQKGSWEGEQVVSEAWVALSTAKQGDLDPADQSLGFDYGFYWWRSPADGAFTAFGHGGQYILVVPDKNLVIVLTAEPDTNGDTSEIGLPQFLVLARIIIAAAGS